MTHRFRNALALATAGVPAHYFQLPVSGMPNPLYRERVYSYELYHQLRTIIDGGGWALDYALSGEIDKGGHPAIRRRCAPDLLFHLPGEMTGNIAVVEIKPINAEASGIRKDIANLSYFVSQPVGYELGILLVYGDAPNGIERFRTAVRQAGLPRLLLYWHRHQNESAELIGA